jgi:GT2 family glycosyltransferase
MVAALLDATVVIVTHNRKAELRRALRSAVAQRGRIEVLVFDDASTDGTPQMVRDEFPQVRLYVSEKSTGHIVHRNRGVRAARAPFVVIIDDDAAFESPDTVLHSVGELAGEPSIGALAIPFANQGGGGLEQHQAPDGRHVWVTHKFIGAAHALRVSAFLEVGGYREDLVHFGEEADLCARLLAAGYVTRVGSAAPATHFASTVRDRVWERYHAARAGIITSYMNQPAALVPPVLAAWTVREVLNIVRRRHAMATVRGIVNGYRYVLHHLGNRRGLHWRVYRTLSELKRRGMMPLEEVRSRLPNLVTA